MSDNDMTYKFNTPLAPGVEDEFRAWADKQSENTNRDITRDLYNYDLRGWFVRNKGKDLKAGSHLTDEFKKPNHPTFSDESKYNGGDFEGGKWGKQDGKWTFAPGRTNVEVHGEDGLADYFKRVEPDVIMVPASPQ